VQLIEIESLDDPRIADYANVRDADLRRRRGLFIVEGRGSIQSMLEHSAHRPLSLLLSHAAFEKLSAVLELHATDIPVYVASQQCVNSIAGITVHRGALALGQHDPAAAPETVLHPDALPAPPSPSRIVLLEDVTDPDNLGQIFRNALAFGVDAIVLSPHCTDPLYRKAIRTSMGASLRVPFALVKYREQWPAVPVELLRCTGHTIVALDPAGVPLVGTAAASGTGGDGFVVPTRAALAFGNEGHGISDALLDQVDHRIRIDMMPEMDSINVATASGIALHLFHASALSNER